MAGRAHACRRDAGPVPAGDWCPSRSWRQCRQSGTRAALAGPAGPGRNAGPPPRTRRQVVRGDPGTASPGRSPRSNPGREAETRLAAREASGPPCRSTDRSEAPSRSRPAGIVPDRGGATGRSTCALLPHVRADLRRTCSPGIRSAACPPVAGQSEGVTGGGSRICAACCFLVPSGGLRPSAYSRGGRAASDHHHKPTFTTARSKAPNRIEPSAWSVKAKRMPSIM